jgi:hypothetical protein
MLCAVSLLDSCRLGNPLTVGNKHCALCHCASPADCATLLQRAGHRQQHLGGSHCPCCNVKCLNILSATSVVCCVTAQLLQAGKPFARRQHSVACCLLLISCRLGNPSSVGNERCALCCCFGCRQQLLCAVLLTQAGQPCCNALVAISSSLEGHTAHGRHCARVQGLRSEPGCCGRPLALQAAACRQCGAQDTWAARRGAAGGGR